ncbi:hypothetical protein GCM10010977_22150 [Citricoccus zhacaiensis]|uniref:Uncharacterized protein n=1 Tax=Citricoccus zhacaiensis TaxID=489142 RepID=A0ABQ2M448_9MICC|nr:hypothetical protein GCM10010977_22150 [Citricoccus zhacaiensis]
MWIVQQDETPDNVVLGVFDDPDEADGYAEAIKDDFPGHVIIEEYPLGYKYTDGSAGFSDIAYPAFCGRAYRSPGSP